MASVERETSLVRVPEWASHRWLRHGFSTRFGGVSTCYGDIEGDLNLGYTAHDSAELVLENRRQAVEEVAGAAGWPLCTVRQVHGTEVRIVDAPDSTPAEADGLISRTPGLMLGIQVADCVPILIADTRQRVVAAIHAGWRGTAAAIVQRGALRLKEEFASCPGDLVAAIGPSIAACCYTVGDEVFQTFTKNFGYGGTLFARRQDGLHLDLAEANRRQLLDAGLPVAAVTLLGECTGCAKEVGRRKYFSHRVEHGFTGRAMGLIGVR